MIEIKVIKELNGESWVGNTDEYRIASVWALFWKETEDDITWQC